MPTNIIEKLSGLSSTQFWRNETATEEMITDIDFKFNLKFPEDYKQLLLYSNGGTVQGSKSTFNYEPAEYLVGHNLSEFFTQQIPDMIVIGDDGGGCIYYYDPKNKLEKGEWALFYASMGALFFKESVYLSPSVTELIDKILSGEHFGDLLFKHV